ncbi:MAG TPA: zinc-ribbon domain-containing protein [Ktedonobacteraceae bacterium]|nr:zinc-ribbon domain-containing protein [Ktedonobacteraceae bacterium]
MQCLKCGAIVPDGIVQCGNCGAPLSEAMSPVPSAVSERGSPYFEPAWAEYSGIPAPMGMSASVEAPSPSILSAPDSYVPPGNYPTTPGSMPPILCHLLRQFLNAGDHHSP